MKTDELVIKIAFMVLKKCDFSHYSAQGQQKLTFFEVIMKFHLKNQEMRLKV